MKSRLPERIQWLPLETLDVGDRTFATTPDWLRPSQLMESVREEGVLSPLRVQSRGDGAFRIVNGFRRAAAARGAGLDRLPCLVHGLDEGPALHLFRGALRENLGFRDFDELERALAILKLVEQFEIAEDELIAQWLPLLGERPDRHHLRRALRIARLPVDVQKALPGLASGIPLKLAHWDPAERGLFLHLSSRLRLGHNRQRELFEVLDELRAVSLKEDSGDAIAVWEKSGAAGIEAETGTPPPVKLARILQILRGIRYPVLARQEARAHDLVVNLHLPPEIQMNLPRFFEGDRIAVQFQFRGPEELRRFADKLREISGSAELRELFALL